jgi:hypothetical protein
MSEPSGQVYSLEEAEVAELALQSQIQQFAQKTYETAQQALNGIVADVASQRLELDPNHEFRYELSLDDKRITVFTHSTPHPQDHKPKQSRKRRKE